MSKPDNLRNCPRCHHIKDDGLRCAAPALRGKKLCHNHERRRRTFPHRRPYRKSEFCRRADFLNVKTNADVMRSINQVINDVLSGQMSDKESRSILYALSTATRFAAPTTSGRTYPTVGAAPFPAGEGALPRVPHPFAQRKGGSFDFASLEQYGFHQRPTTNDQRPLPQIPPNWRPKTVDEVFAMIPGCEDLKSLLTPEMIAFIEHR